MDCDTTPQQCLKVVREVEERGQRDPVRVELHDQIDVAGLRRFSARRRAEKQQVSSPYRAASRPRRERSTARTASPREPGGEGAIVLGHPDGGMQVEPGVRPPQHPDGLLLVEQRQAHEEPQHGAAERLRQSCGVVGGPGAEGAVRPEAAVGDEQVQDSRWRSPPRSTTAGRWI